jgi:hypothetical protein
MSVEFKDYIITTVHPKAVTVSNRTLNIYLNLKGNDSLNVKLNEKQVSYLKITHRTNLNIIEKSYNDLIKKKSFKERSKAISKANKDSKEEVIIKNKPTTPSVSEVPVDPSLTSENIGEVTSSLSLVAKEAIEVINKSTDPDFLEKFVEGDNRITVTNSAEMRIEELIKK